MKTLKAVIPVAGLGMHMLPATKAIPKEMLPIVDKPMIQYLVEECAAAGIKEIVLVTHASKNAIENHFDTSYELEALLEARVKNTLLAEVQAICPKGLTIMNVRQGEPLGLGHAILSAKPMLGDSPFVVVLPDILLDDSTYNNRTENLASMVKRFHENGHSQVLVQSIPREHLPEYSVISCNEDVSEPGDHALIQSFIEKPQDLSTIDSDLAAVGRYVLSADIWPLLEKTEPGAWGRIQLTDAIASLVNHQPVDALYLTGKSFNCGRKLGYMQAFVTYGLRNEKWGKDFREKIKSLL
ncbi:sugar phosphate nucleotidyltransferase [Sodalis sp. C49]|uniref:sugar phosphate nucleotidyltransferase n=1 Tax=unclassified Sodalis (in: enterobacteria) TaxID=2636512 RepID=UPI003965C5FD